MREIRDIVKKPAAWAEKTQGEKIGFILMTSIIVLNVSFAGYMVVKIKSLLNEDESLPETKKDGRGSLSLQEIPAHDEEEHISVLKSEDSSAMETEADGNTLFD